MENGNSIESVYRAIAGYYEQIFPINNEKIKFLLPFLNQESEILDVGCSTGELLHRLAPLCNSATGIDPSKSSIELAKEKQLNSEYRNLNFCTATMEDTPYIFEASSFSHIICLGNTLAHIGRPEDLSQVLEGFFHIMKPGGILIIQLVNYSRVLGFRDFSFMPLKKDRIVFQRNYTPLDDKGKIEFHTKIKDYENGFTSDNACQLTTIKLPELRRELRKNRFRNIKYFGSFRRSPWTVESGPLILTARKPAHMNPGYKRINC